jgi:arabinose-5-phosphate isomerase
VPRPVSAVALRGAHAVCTAASMAPKSAPKSPKLHVVKDSRPKTKARPASTQTSALEYAAQVLTAEAEAILSVRPRLGEGFVQAIELLLSCTSHVVVTGIGKPGFIAQKLSATLASIGIRSFYLHPAEAVHGDLGRVGRDDVVLALSNSGATEELVRVLPGLKRLGAKIIALTGDSTSALARAADVIVDIGRIDEACPMGLVPTASSAALHAVGDALAMTLLKQKELTHEEYASFHPGGKLGRSVMRVSEVMRSGTANPLVRETDALSKVVVVMTNTPGRPGAANVVDKAGKLLGIFTDGDLRRLVERGVQDFDAPVSSVMGKFPKVVSPSDLVQNAAKLMREMHVDQVPVVDAAGKAVGLLDVQDLLAVRYV